MRKRAYALMIPLLCLLAAGCSPKPASVIGRAARAYSAAQTVTMEISMLLCAEQTAAPYRLTQTQSAENAAFTLLEPTVIAGVEATVDEKGLQFLGEHIAVQTMPMGYTPFDLAYYAVISLQKGYFSSVGSELLEDVPCHLLSGEVMVNETPLTANLWLDAATYQLIKYEFFDRSQRVLEANVLKFEAK